MQAILWSDEAWKSVSKQTITKCFQKAGFPAQQQLFTPQDDDNESPTHQFDQLSHELVGRPFNELPSIEDDIDTEDTATIDFTQDAASILRDLDNDKDEDDDEPCADDVTTPAVPTLTEALTALSTLKDFFTSKGMINQLAAATEMDTDMFNAAQNFSSQSSLAAFGFLKKH